jgi:hypothetical protein
VLTGKMSDVFPATSNLEGGQGFRDRPSKPSVRGPEGFLGRIGPLGWGFGATGRLNLSRLGQIPACYVLAPRRASDGGIAAPVR